MFSLAAWHLWIIGGILLIILEMTTHTFFLFSFGSAALATALVAYNGAETAWQLGAFAIVSFLMIILIRPLVVRGLYHRSDDRPTNVNALRGQLATVVDSIPGALRPGRVKLGSEEWRALSEDDSPIPEDTVVTITKIDSATLTVRPVMVE
jgi:membrane protein implicated in regulation of membrane protease activity